MARAKKIPLITDFNHIPAEALVPEEEQPYPLPAHWKWVRLGAVIDLLSGRDTKLADCNDSGLGIPYVMGASNIRDSRLEIERWIEKPEVVSHAGDLLLTVKGTVGKLYIQTEPELNLSRQLMGLHPTAVISVSYLERFFSTHVQQLSAKAVGLIPGISRAHILDLAIPLPPLEEQKQIVAYLDEKLGKIDSVREKLQDFLDHADKRKDNLIQAGVTGHLSEKWREKNQDCSRTMFTNEELQQVSVPETWKWLPLSDVATILNGDRGKNYAGRSTWIDSGIPFVNAGTLQNSVLTEEGMNYISKETYSKLNGGKLRPGDILFCLRGSLGKCALNTSYQEGAIGSSIAIIRSGDSANPRFSFYYFLSPISQIMIDEFDNGSAQPNLSAKSLKRFKVPLPPVGEQEEIARILDEQLERIERTDKLVAEVLERLDTMKQQIVSAALAGRLSLQVS